MYPPKLAWTGMYIRVERDGKWENVCIEDLTKEERHAYLETKNITFVYAVVDLLVDSLRQLGDMTGLEYENERDI